MLLALALQAAPALALQRPQSGPLIELGFGGGYSTRQPVLSGQASFGWWFGPYDDEYALGRFTALVATTHVDFGQDGLGVTPILELRRAMDLFVLAPYWTLGAGPIVRGGEVGAAARVGGGLKFRRSRKLGFTGRLVVGADYLGGSVRPAATLTIGGGWSTPVR